MEELTFKSKAEGCEGAATQRGKAFQVEERNRASYSPTRY